MKKIVVVAFTTVLIAFASLIVYRWGWLTAARHRQSQGVETPRNSSVGPNTAALEAARIVARETPTSAGVVNTNPATKEPELEATPLGQEGTEDTPQNEDPRPADQPGVASRYFADHTFNTLRKSVVTQALDLTWSAPPIVPLEGNRFWVEWEGRLSVPVSGRYDFRLEGDGDGYLYLDGKRVISGGERRGDRLPRGGWLLLHAGMHTIRLAAIEEKLEGVFALKWKPAGNEDYSHIDSKYLSHIRSQADWHRSPRQAAQVGLEWLQSDAIAWQRANRCFGCHVQGQVIMGLSVAKVNQYTISEEYFNELVEFTPTNYNSDGTYHSGQHATATQFAAMALSFSDRLTRAKGDQALLKSVDWLLARQTAGLEAIGAPGFAATSRYLPI
jgi:hypothetical protein